MKANVSVNLRGGNDMPSIEIACVGLAAPVQVAVTGLAVAAEQGLKSQCAPSRFQIDFDALAGCLYRLGSRSVRDRSGGGGFFGYELLSDDSRNPFPPSFLEFAPQHVPEIRSVLSGILASSPLGQALFTTDWQFGPEWTHRFGPVTFEEFWRLHESRTLYLNTAYSMLV